MTRDRCRWLDSTGQPKHLDSFWCTVHNKSLILVQHDHGFVPGQLIERDLPNHTVERYRIVEIEFERRQVVNDWDCWKLHVEKLDSNGMPVTERRAPVPQSLVISNSQNVQVGNGNSIVIRDALQQLRHAIEHADATENDKETAKGLLEKLTHNPLVCAVVGGLVGGVCSSK